MRLGRKSTIAVIAVALIAGFVAWKKGLLFKGVAINQRNFKFADGVIGTPGSKGYNLVVTGQTVTIAGRTDITGSLQPDGSIKWSSGSVWEAA